jgi:hypothetical protein
MTNDFKHRSASEDILSLWPPKGMTATCDWKTLRMTGLLIVNQSNHLYQLDGIYKQLLYGYRRREEESSHVRIMAMVCSFRIPKQSSRIQISPLRNNLNSKNQFRKTSMEGLLSREYDSNFTPYSNANTASYELRLRKSIFI